MLKIMLVIFTLFMMSCSSLSEFSGNKSAQFNKPRINLFLYSKFQSEREKYISIFASKGYDVELRQGELPEHQEKSFIIHSPSMLNPNHYSDVEDIVSIIKGAGISEINQYQYFLGKHSYTPTNVGVYLL